MKNGFMWIIALSAKSILFFALSGCALIVSDKTISPTEAKKQIELHSLECRRDLVWATMRNGQIRKLRVVEKTDEYIAGPDQEYEARGKYIKIYFKDIKTVELRQFTPAACLRM